MLQLPVLLPLLALAVRGAPTGNTDGGGACSVVLVPVLVPVDTTVAAPNPTNSVESPITGGRAGAVNSVGRENKMVMFAQGASSTKPDTAAAAQSASTTMDRPSKVTSAAVRTASSNKLSPTGTSTTTLTTTVTVSGKESSYTPGTDQDDGVEVQGRKNVVYFTNWSEHGGNYTPAEIPAQDVTHLLYAFGDISSTGEVISSDSQADIHRQYGGTQRRSSQAQGNIGQIYNIKQQNRNMKALLSIGGASYSASGKFAPATSTVDGRQRFARSAVKLITNWGFDGIDIDWEYPETESEAADFVSLLQETRYELNKYAKDNNQTYHYLLTVAASAGPSHYRLLNLGAMDRYVDSWHLMAYDYAGAWDSTTGHQANVYPDLSNAASTKFNTEQAVDDYIAAGIEPDKIILGFPLYGRSFAQTSGLGKPFSGVGQGSIEPGVWLYKDLPRPGAAVTVDHAVLAAYSYDPAARSLISYDNEESARLKANYLLKKGLGGAVFWEASGDKPGEDSLVASLARSMWPLQSSQNMLEYPDSEFENIRMGF